MLQFSMSSLTDADRLMATQLDEILRRPATQPVVLPCALAPRLLLGGFTEAQDVRGLEARGVTHILNMASHDYEQYADARLPVGSFVRKSVPAEDYASYPLFLRHLDECLAFWRECQAADDGILFIHCMAGINRSGAMAIALLLDAEDSVDLLSVARLANAKRGPLCTNRGFQAQLVQYARSRGTAGFVDTSRAEAQNQALLEVSGTLS